MHIYRYIYLAYACMNVCMCAHLIVSDGIFLLSEKKNVTKSVSQTNSKISKIQMYTCLHINTNACTFVKT